MSSDPGQDALNEIVAALVGVAVIVGALFLWITVGLPMHGF